MPADRKNLHEKELSYAGYKGENHKSDKHDIPIAISIITLIVTF